MAPPWHRLARRFGRTAFPLGTTEVLALALLALALRLLQLTDHSLWFDETMSVHWARQSVGRILQVGLGLVEDKHPPGYYLLLHLWIRAFGDGEVALRTLGALLGALAVPPLVRLGEALWDRRTGLLAGLYGACSPILIWYSQEVRMFGLAATLATAGALCLVEGLRRGGWRWWCAYVVLLLFGCFSYLFTAFLLPTLGLLTLGVFFSRWRQGMRKPWRDGAGQGLLAQAVLAAGIAPLAWRALQVGGAEASPGRPFVDFASAAFRLSAAWSVWRVPWNRETLWGVVGAFWGLALLGMVARPPAKGVPGGRSFLAAAVLGPLLVGNLFLAVDGTVFTEPRYLLPVVPFLGLATAAGVGVLGRRAQALGGFVGLAWAVLLVAALPAMWLPQNRREDWRAASAYLEGHAGPQDVVLVHPGFLRPALEYYYAGPAPVVAPFGSPLDSPEEVERPLASLAPSQVVWLVQSHLEGPDPARLVEGWLAARFPLVTEQYPAGIALKGYATRYRLAAPPEDAISADRAWGGLRLVGYRVDTARLRPTDDCYHPPSNWLHLTTYWTRAAAVGEGLRCEARLLDALGQVWGLSLARGRDAWGVLSPAQWSPGEVIRLDQDINLNPATPPGRYRVAVRVLDAKGDPLPTVEGTDLAVLAEVEVLP
ncbi:MAG: glycosyltransferase family 39 protein [Anaerolineae bacterium]